MNPVNLIFVLISETCSIVGQLFFKHAMLEPQHKGPRFMRSFGLGILAMAIGFFLWLGLLRKYELSYLYPFDGLGRVVLVLGASVFLKEKASARLWVGVGLISAGVMLVSVT